MNITLEIKEKIHVLAQEHELTMVVLFGSQATGETHAESDVDIAVQSMQMLSERELVDLSYAFGLIFGNDRVDVVQLAQAGPLLKRRILDEAIILYEKTGHEFSIFEVEALRRYAEARPLFAIRHEKLTAPQAHRS